MLVAEKWWFSALGSWHSVEGHPPAYGRCRLAWRRRPPPHHTSREAFCEDASRFGPTPGTAHPSRADRPKAHVVMPCGPHPSGSQPNPSPSWPRAAQPSQPLPAILKPHGTMPHGRHPSRPQPNSSPSRPCIAQVELAPTACPKQHRRCTSCRPSLPRKRFN